MPQWKETLLGGGEQFDTLGSPDACARFDRLIRTSLSAPPCRVHFAVWHRLLDVIRDPRFKWVDGAIQYGEFNEVGDFSLYGSVMLELENGFLHFKRYIRGTNLEEAHNPMLPDDLHVRYTYMSPFVQEVGAFESDSFYHGDHRYALDELITVVPYESGWPEAAASEIAYLGACINGIKAIEHIGSTAVPGMAAVPFLDIAVSVNELWDPKTPAFTLSHFGYEYLGDVGISGRRLFRKRGTLSVNVHVCQREGGFWNSALALREMLRTDTTAASKFSQEKLRIVNLSSRTLFSYNRRKTKLLQRLATAAGVPFD